MARPKIPLISRRSALAAALRIIDEEGLDALSIRRLGDELNVNGASFYHHFKSKDDILVGVAQLALADVRAPETDVDWREWLPTNARLLRDALLAHPNLIPVLLRREGMGIGAEQLEASTELLERQGVPTHLILTLIDTLEVFAIASALHEVNAATEKVIEASEEQHPRLARAHRLRRPVPDAVFDEICVSIITTIEASMAARKRAPRRKAAASA